MDGWGGCVWRARRGEVRNTQLQCRKDIFTKKTVTRSGPKRVQRQKSESCGPKHKERPSRKGWHKKGPGNLVKILQKENVREQRYEDEKEQCEWERATARA